MMNSFLKKIAIVLPTMVIANVVCLKAQTNITGQKKLNTITTGVPFLRISPDARAGAMGDVGIATESDANDTHWNIAKMVNNKKKTGAALTYTPWLRDLVPDINLAYLSGYTKFGENDNQAVSASLRYFNLGTIAFKSIDATDLGTGYPRELAFNLGYSRKLSENLSLGVAGRYTNSNLSAGPATLPGTVFKPGNAFSTDIGVFYTKPMKKDNEDGDRLNFGAAITNLGTKISYNNVRKDFLPTNLGIGAAYKYKIDEYNSMNFALDMNKLLVPSPQFYKNVNGEDSTQYYPTNVSVINGLFSSFGDAPGGVAEEFKEIMWSTGVEYAYQNQFFARAGYFYEDYTKGNRKFATLGLGFKYNVFNLNMAYLVPSGSGINRNPLSNTLRFTLLFDFDAAKKKNAADDDKDEE
ncbi:MAG: type IX secretion system outer membrane channel protein PorV [Chitinophagaceae bacterium]|nr:type IX secretion system outer membrane channel protein PorV [Chitinophagaceae bacterium]